MTQLVIDNRTMRRVASDLFAQGFGYKRTAKILGLNMHLVRDWKLRKRFKQRERETNLKWARSVAIGYFEKGWGYKRTADLLRVNLYTVRYWLKEYKKGRSYV